MMNYKPITILVIVLLAITNLGQLKAQNSELSMSFNQFSFDLYQEIKLEKGNVFLSPLSTYYALLSAYEGSENKTKAAFEKVLYLKDSASSNYDNLYKLESNSDSLFGLKISNAVWVDKRFQVEAAFKNAVSSKYSSDFKQTEFTNTEQAVSDINHWVADKTNQRITNMVSPSDINSETKLMISNAVYFKGEWLNKFEKRRTTESTFFTDNENQYKVDFMNITENLNYFENESFQFITKPYKDSDVSFCIMLPKELDGLETIENNLNADFFNEILEKTATKEVWLSIPKIKIETSYKLKSALTNMGLNTVFNNEADFSGILKNESLSIEQVAHKTYIDLNEDQTEATAATTTNVYITGLPSYKTFKADHPFVFFIVDNKTKAMVFMGRYTMPQNGKIIDKANFVDNLLKRNNKKLDWGGNDKILILIAEGKKLNRVDIQDVNFNDIDHLEVYKKEDVKKYTTEDYYGVVVITLKKNKKITK
ncbi:serpin B [Lutibacter agarilyticus]|uniref:Serpin B n=1 Tax=Lutibacter agarilyticus TaxID=1109740 RepID=A0A238YMC7_9FLAO|nr:serpin family protein [Lutibacter agarilyticus]SNR71589.1 serpin B [Lutibacter agarilyticus]